MKNVRMRPVALSAETRRVPLSLRVSPNLYEEISARAEEDGRTMTFEAEVLLEQGLLAERIGGGKAWRLGYEVTRCFDYRLGGNSGNIQSWRDEGEPDPLDHPAAYGLAMARAITSLARNFPGKPTYRDIDAWLEAARAMIVEGLKERDA